MYKATRALIIGSVLAAIAAVGVACGSSRAGAENAEKIKEFDKFAVLWLGAEYDASGSIGKMPLRSAEYTISPAGRFHPEIATFTITYGTCEIRPGRTSCSLPLQLDFYDACKTPKLADEVKSRTETIRGVDAVIQTDEVIWIETGEFTVSVRTAFPVIEGQPLPNDLENSKKVVEALFGANDKAKHITKGTDFKSKDKGACSSATSGAANEYSMEVNIAPAADAVGGATFVAQVSVVHGGVTVASGCFDGLVNGIDDDSDTIIDEADEVGLGEPFAVPPFGCYTAAQWSVDYDQALVDLLPLGTTGTTGIVRVAAAPSQCNRKSDNGDRALAACANVAPPPSAIVAYTGPAWNLTFDCIAPGTAVFTLITAGGGGNVRQRRCGRPAGADAHRQHQLHRRGALTLGVTCGATLECR